MSANCTNSQLEPLTNVQINYCALNILDTILNTPNAAVNMFPLAIQ